MRKDSHSNSKRIVKIKKIFSDNIFGILFCSKFNLAHLIIEFASNYNDTKKESLI
jgi:hypothetical protein